MSGLMFKIRRRAKTSILSECCKSITLIDMFRYVTLAYSTQDICFIKLNLGIIIVCFTSTVKVP